MSVWEGVLPKTSSFDGNDYGSEFDFISVQRRKKIL